ncbi:MBOAT family protein [Rhodonellum sp.]|uniref:MBOAT family O-acyltransferase n=1 Tax=Rhodonellum sp. TaxID=2231180 RepID=UPI00271ED062|nr:MBOAT family O-acyltransferase [Rhodonellum sp.]MDO9552134.1 MBOAT family O-acyltransferase [Rhodonellum sp.]
MAFNSIDFAVFLPIVFILYWFVAKRNLRAQNLLIVMASCFFYGMWDWRFLALILFSTLVDFGVGLGLAQTEKIHRRKLLLWMSVGVNLGFLGFFKYYNFFLDNFLDTFSLLGSPIQANSLNIILPVGISFYTFQTMSYTIDVYRKKLQPTRDFIAFSAFVSFFPQLVAGPIERASNLLPQFFKERVFDQKKAVDGLKQILWGLFKKMVIADNCAQYANTIFNNSEIASGSMLAMGAFFFAFQIYGDFSGYSDIAIGTSRLFGFDLMKNFATPYFSRNIAEFWRRWHISLSTWFRDYVYIPLGGSQVEIWPKVRNIFIIFLVSGFWHGANWTFIVWGALNAVYFLPSLFLGSNRKHLEIVAQGRVLPSFREFLSMLATFSFTTFAWIFFRAENIDHAIRFVGGIFSTSFFTVPNLYAMEGSVTLLVFIFLFLILEWRGRENEYAISELGARSTRVLRWSMYVGFILVINIFGNNSADIEFIYFQF